MNGPIDLLRVLFILAGGFILLCLVVIFLPVILLVLLIYLIFFRYKLKKQVDRVRGSRFYHQYGNFGFPRGGTRPPASATQEDDDNTIDVEYTVLDNAPDHSGKD